MTLATFALSVAMTTPARLADVTAPSGARSPYVLKQAVSAIAARTKGGAAATLEEAAEAALLIEELEGCAEMRGGWPSRGPRMAGAWDQIYTTNKSAGTVSADGTSSRRRLAGPLTGRVQAVVEYAAPECEYGIGATPERTAPGFTYAQRVRSKLLLGLQAELETSVEAVNDGVSWEVSFDSVRWSVLGGRLRLWRRRLPPGGGGRWRTTYLDDDTRIVRTQSRRGGPPAVYVHRRSGIEWREP